MMSKIVGGPYSAKGSPFAKYAPHWNCVLGMNREYLIWPDYNYGLCRAIGSQLVPKLKLQEFLTLLAAMPMNPLLMPPFRTFPLGTEPFACPLASAPPIRVTAVANCCMLGLSETNHGMLVRCVVNEIKTILCAKVINYLCMYQISIVFVSVTNIHPSSQTFEFVIIARYFFYFSAFRS